MNQKDLWNRKWTKIDKTSEVSSYAKKCINLVKNNKFKRVLDLGCGDGKDSIFFCLNGLKVTATDFSENGIKHLKKDITKRKLKNIHVKIRNLENLDFSDNSFDVVYANVSLHYFDDKTTKKIFNKIHGLLKKRGYFFLRVKSTDDSLYGKGRKISKDMYEYENQIRHFFSKDFMKNNLEPFKVITIKRVSSLHKRLEGEPYKASYLEAIAMK